MRSADEAYAIGPNAPRDSYLRIDRVLEVAVIIDPSTAEANDLATAAV